MIVVSIVIIIFCYYHDYYIDLDSYSYQQNLNHYPVVINISYGYPHTHGQLVADIAVHVVDEFSEVGTGHSALGFFLNETTHVLLIVGSAKHKGQVGANELHVYQTRCWLYVFYSTVILAHSLHFHAGTLPLTFNPHRLKSRISPAGWPLLGAPGQPWPLGRFPEAWRGLRPGAQLSPVLGEALRCARCARCARPVAGSDLWQGLCSGWQADGAMDGGWSALLRLRWIAGSVRYCPSFMLHILFSIRVLYSTVPLLLTLVSQSPRNFCTEVQWVSSPLKWDCESHPVNCVLKRFSLFPLGVSSLRRRLLEQPEQHKYDQICTKGCGAARMRDTFPCQKTRVSCWSAWPIGRWTWLARTTLSGRQNLGLMPTFCAGL